MTDHILAANDLWRAFTFAALTAVLAIRARRAR
jgi:hypothetical protein